MIETEQVIRCGHCKKPIIQKSKQRPRLYCNDVCRQLDYRRRRRERTKAELLHTVKERWGGYLPATQQLLNEIMQGHGEPLAVRVAAAVASEVAADLPTKGAALEEQLKQDLEERLEELYRTDTERHHFKKWLQQHLQPNDVDFAKRFLADSRFQPYQSRSWHIARLTDRHGYTDEDRAVFVELWKDMLFEGRW